MSVLSQISNCQGLGRKNKHEILKTDRTTTELMNLIITIINITTITVITSMFNTTTITIVTSILNTTTIITAITSQAPARQELPALPAEAAEHEVLELGILLLLLLLI